MTSYEFEKAAKNAVIEMIAKRGIETSIEELQLVWFAHLLGNKKCMVYGPCMANLYAEVTYSDFSDMMYVDLYQKMDHRGYHGNELNFSAGVDKLL